MARSQMRVESHYRYYPVCRCAIHITDRTARPVSKRVGGACPGVLEGSGADAYGIADVVNNAACHADVGLAGRGAYRARWVRDVCGRGPSPAGRGACGIDGAQMTAWFRARVAARRAFGVASGGSSPIQSVAGIWSASRYWAAVRLESRRGRAQCLLDLRGCT